MSKRRRRAGRLQTLSARFEILTRPPALVTAVWIIAVIALITASALTVPRMQAYASMTLWKEQTEIRFLAAPAWVEGELAETLLTMAGERISGDPLRRADLVAARKTLLQTAWCEEVYQVRRAAPNVIESLARFVQPLAVIRDDQQPRDHLVDTEGRLLPRSYEPGTAKRFAAIIGVREPRPSMYGRFWEGADITAALRVLRFIEDRPWRGQVAAVDVSQTTTGPGGVVSIRLITDRGCTIRWGRPPGEEGGREVPLAQNLDYLDYHFRQYGHIDRGFLQELDITGDVVTGR